MNFSKMHPILKEYKHSPFFYCFLFVSITEIFIAYQIVYDIREIFWSRQVWIAVLIPALVITFFIKIPVKSLLGSRAHLTERTPLLNRSLMGGTIWAMLMTDVVLFLASVFIIIGTNHPETIIDKPQFEENHIAGIIMEAIIPLANYFFYIPTKKAIRKQLSLGNFYDRSEEIAFAFPFIWMFFIISLIVIVFAN